MHDGKARGMGLGAYPAVTLQAARREAAGCREKLRQGIDPLTERERERVQRRLNAANAVTFKAAAERYIEAHRPGWKNAKHAEQWTNTLATYAFPVIGELPVQAVETAHMLKILEPIWLTKNETASRVRMRIEAVLDAATARKGAPGEALRRDALCRASRVLRCRHQPGLGIGESTGIQHPMRRPLGRATGRNVG
jgi:hypothetical protein